MNTRRFKEILKEELQIACLSEVNDSKENTLISKVVAKLASAGIPHKVVDDNEIKLLDGSFGIIHVGRTVQCSRTVKKSIAKMAHEFNF